jgi:anti-sigma B factor antagonist
VQNHFRVEVRRHGSASVVSVSGELDLSTSAALEEELTLAADSDAEMLVVDLHQLEFMDSTGLSTLVKAQQAVQGEGKRFVLVRGPQQVQRLLTLTGVAERIEVADSLEALLPD